jgi:hypothetical protein
MHRVGVAWACVVVMMALVEALSSNGSVPGVWFTLLLCGVLPLGIVLYLMGTPLRRRARRRAEQYRAEQYSAAQPDGGGHAPADSVAPVRKEV